MVNKLKQWMPPILIERLRPLLRHGVYYSGRYEDWDSASKSATGYDADVILEKVKHATLEVKAGRAAFERDTVLFNEVQHSFPLLAGLVRASVENNGNLSVLDFGGSLGSSYFQCRNFLSTLSSISWNVVEQPHFVRCGRQCIKSESLAFYFSIAEVMEAVAPNVALLSSVLQYLSEPHSILSELMDREINYIILDRTPFSDEEFDVITVQHVSPAIYPASYPCRIFSKRTLMAHLSSQYETVAEFESKDGAAYVAGTRFAFGGAILRKRK